MIKWNETNKKCANAKQSSKTEKRKPGREKSIEERFEIGCICGYRRNHFEMIEKTTPQLVLYKKIMKIC